MPFLADINLSSVILSPTSSERNVITPLTDAVPLTIKGINGQSAKYLYILDSTGVDMFSFNANGSFQLYGHTFISEGNPSAPFQVDLAQAGGWLLIEDSGATTAAGFYGATSNSGVAKVRTISTSDLPTIAHSTLSGVTSGDDHTQYAKLSVSSSTRNVITSDEYDGTTLTVRSAPSSDYGGDAILITNTAGTSLFRVGESVGISYVQCSTQLVVPPSSLIRFGTYATVAVFGDGYISMARPSSANAGYLNTSATSTNAGGYLNLAAGATGAGGYIDTSNDGGNIITNGSGSIGLGTTGKRTTIAGSGSTVTITMPAITGTAVVLAGAQTFTGAKTFNSATCLLRNAGNTASATLATTASTSRTMTFPDLTATVIVASSTSTTASQICMATTTAGGVTFATMSGDATIASGGALTIANNAVTLAKMATMATASILGRNTAGTGNVEVLSASTTKTLLSLNNVENTALSTWAGTSNITTLGTVSTGTWSATTIAINKGGTGQTTANAAFNALAPSQTSNSGKFLTTNGTDTSWATVSATPAGSTGYIQFNTSSAFNADSALYWDNTNKRLGLGTTSPNSPLEIKPAASTNLPAIKIDQTLTSNDNDPFIRFEGTSAADATKNISTATGWTVQGYIRMNVNGTDYWMPFYSKDISP